MPITRCANYCRYQLLLAALVLAAVLTGCAGSSQAEHDAPVAVVKQFVAASSRKDLDGLLALIEPVAWRKQIIPELQQALAHIDAITYSEPRYELVANDGSLAQVHFVGTVILDLRNQQPLPPQKVDQVFELVRLEGRWYIRAVNLPRIQPSQNQP